MLLRFLVVLKSLRSLKILEILVGYEQINGTYKLHSLAEGEVIFAIAYPNTYPCLSVGEWVSESFIVSDLEIAIASPSFASLFALLLEYQTH